MIRLKREENKMTLGHMQGYRAIPLVTGQQVRRETAAWNIAGHFNVLHREVKQHKLNNNNNNNTMIIRDLVLKKIIKCDGDQYGFQSL